jgi:16S rRNA (guanine527-N7)-methyltransferase
MSPSALDQTALAHAIASLGLTLSGPTADVLERHAALVAAASAELNLTRITEPAGVAVQHVADSLACLLALDAGRPLRVADVGSGAGWPGLALAIACPSWHVTLVESTGKKAAFLERAAIELGLAERVTVRAERVERVAHEGAFRESHDAAVARAVAPLATLAEYLLPLVRIGGTAIAMKAGDTAPERQAAHAAVGRMGGTGERVLTYRLPGLDRARDLVVWEKGLATPDLYPRRTGVPARNPIT